jgi:HrpA-like RNA helicase
VYLYELMSGSRLLIRPYRGPLDYNGRLTWHGESAAEYPVDPYWLVAYVEARRNNYLREMIVIATACSASDNMFARNYTFRHVGQKARRMFAHYPTTLRR